MQRIDPDHIDFTAGEKNEFGPQRPGALNRHLEPAMRQAHVLRALECWKTFVMQAGTMQIDKRLRLHRDDDRSLRRYAWRWGPASARYAIQMEHDANRSRPAVNDAANPISRT